MYPASFPAVEWLNKLATVTFYLSDSIFGGRKHATLWAILIKLQGKQQQKFDRLAASLCIHKPQQ